MLRTTNITNKNIVVAIFIAFAVFFEMYFFKFDDTRFTIIVSSGVAAGFYISFGNKVLPGIITSILLTTIIFVITINNFTFINSVVFSLSFLLFTIITIYIFGYLLEKYDCKLPNTLPSALKYMFALTISVSVTSIFPAFQLSIMQNTNFIIDFLDVIKPSFLGLFVFGTTIIFSNHYDEYFSFKKMNFAYKELMYTIVFTLSCWLIFTNTEAGLDFPYFGPIFILLFLVNAFTFNYRMLIYVSIIYTTSYNTLLVFPVVNQVPKISPLNTYLLILISITIFAKVLNYTIKESNKLLTKSNLRLEDMMDSTFKLIKIKDTLDDTDDSYIQNYMHNVYSIALKIFDKFDYSLAVLKTNGVIDVIDTTGYDINFIRNLKIKSSSINWDIMGPAHSGKTSEYIERLVGERFRDYKDHFPNTKESIRFVIKIGDNHVGGVIFDISESSKEKVTKTDYDNIKAFQKLINSFYDANVLAIKNNALKDDIVLSLIRTLELYDQYTGGHSEDVALISRKIAERMNLDKTLIYNVYWAGIVHDIGKIGINSDIINKPGKLTLEEYETVKQHPVFGYEILAKSQDLKDIAILVKHHHEWWNGSGYPDQLATTKIPLGAQILQVADSVSSMATKRSYTTIKTDNQILNELKMYKGTQFSPKIADIMIDLITEGILKEIYQNRGK